jgi:tetratricopeptide (TPR) repeat protein
VKTNNGSYPLDTLISYNSKLDVTLFTIEATGLPAANLDGGYKTGHERDSVVRYIVKSLERYRKTVKKGKDTHDVPEKLAKLGITPEEVKPIPDGAEAFLNRGFVYEASERYIEAIDAYVQAVRMKPDFSDAYVNLGLVYYRLARYPEAIEAYQHALKLNPDSPSIWNKLGTTYVILGEYSMALDTFKKALRGDPNNPETHYHLGIAYFLSGDKDAALEEYILLQRLDEQRAENLFDLIYR